MKLPSVVAALACLLACTPTLASGPRAFHAEYASLRNGNELGVTTLELRDDGDGNWTLRSETRGTAGLARFAGVHVVETSRFRWNDGRPESIAYTYRQESSLRDRARDIAFDHRHGEVRTSEKGKAWRYPIQPGLIDRQLVTLAILTDLGRDAPALEYAIATKDRVERRRYERKGREAVEVPAGRYDAVRVEYRSGGEGGRSTVGWYAESAGWLPVLLEQTARDGERVTLRLRALR